jgi:hypothetical protein
MHSCALVSVNGGWNLLIGAQTESGAWEPLRPPPACSQVFDEAEKDSCFATHAGAEIMAHPLKWVRRAGAKWSATFDYFGAAPFYLQRSNPTLFGERAKWMLGGLETMVHRATLLLAVATLHRRGLPLLGKLGKRRRRIARGAWFERALRAPRSSQERMLQAFAVATIAFLAFVHGIFFGAGRYGLVLVPVALGMAALRTPYGGPSASPASGPGREGGRAHGL